MDFGVFSYAFWPLGDLGWGSAFLDPLPVFLLSRLPFFGYEPFELHCRYQPPDCSLSHTLIMSCDGQVHLNELKFSHFFPYGYCFGGLSHKYLLTSVSCLFRTLSPDSVFFTLCATKLIFCWFTIAQLWSFIWLWKFRIEMSILKSFGSHHLKDHIAHWPMKFYFK